MGNDVKKLYAVGNAKWYDFFKLLWNKFVASKAEDRLMLFLRNNLNKDKTILELGCGTALNLQKINSSNIKFMRYLGVDLSPDMLAIAKNKFKEITNIEFKRGDITKLNIKERFDIIICTWVLSHLKTPHTAVNEVQKLLKPKGRIFLIFFTRPKWYVRFWLGPLARYLFKARYVNNEEIKKFKNVRTRGSFSANIATTIEINNDK